jgi:hypothetical protein
MDDLSSILPLTSTQEDIIETLLQRCNFDHDERSRLETSSKSMTENEAEELIWYLKCNQLNPITSGWNYSQTDIVRFNKPN